MIVLQNNNSGRACLIGWIAKAKVWVWGAFQLEQDTRRGQKAIPGPACAPPLLVICLVFTAVTRTAAHFLRLNVRRCFPGGTALFVMPRLIQLIGHEAYLTATADKWAKSRAIPRPLAHQ